MKVMIVDDAAGGATAKGATTEESGSSRLLARRVTYAVPTAFVVLAGLAGMLSWKPIPHVELLFIGLFIYPAMALFGTRWGLAAAAAGSTVAFWDDGGGALFGVLLCLAETATAGWAVRRLGASLTIAVLLFWLAPGQGFVFASFHYALERPMDQAALIVYNGALTSLGCAAAVKILIPWLHRALVRYPRLYPVAIRRPAPALTQLTPQSLSTALTVLLLLAGMLLQLIYTARHVNHDMVPRPEPVVHGLALTYYMISLAIVMVFPLCRLLTRRLVVDLEHRQEELAQHAAEATEKLDRERQRLEELMTNIHDVVWSLDSKTGRLLYMNAACRELFGHPEDFFTGGFDWVYQLVHEEDIPALLTYHMNPARVEGGYATIRFRIHHPDGTMRWIQDRSWQVLNAEGQLVRIDGISTDITETIYAQEGLFQLSFELSREKARIEVQRNLTQSILEASREGMLLCSPNGDILFSNSRLEAFFGPCCSRPRTLDEMFRCLEGLEPEAARLLLQDLHTFLQKGGSGTAYSRTFSYTREGSRHAYSVYAEPVPDGLGLESGRLLVFRDRTQEELEDVMKEDLANQISHELRTPLTSILGFSEILNHKELSPERQRQYIHTIYNEAVRLSRLVDDFLDLQRMEAGHQRYYYVPVDLRELAAEAAENWGLSDRQRLRLELPEHPASVMADADRLKQVLHNLISNAFKYSPDVTPVTVRVRNGDQGTVTVEVQDTGLGIPEADQGSVFRKFYRVDHADRRKIPGSGLGLTIVKQIVEAHKGQIAFRSQHGAGSTFTLTFPAYELPEVAGKHLLIVRDDAYAEELAALLAEEGQAVLRLPSFEEALHAMQAGGRPRSVTAGLVGAGLMNGLEFAALLRLTAACPLLFLETLERGGGAAGQREGSRHMARVFTSEEVLALVRRNGTKSDSGSIGRAFSCGFPAQDLPHLQSQLAKYSLHPFFIEEDGPAVRLEFGA